MTPLLATEGGSVAGLVTDRGVTAFLGVPYAAPPVGPRRFRPPEPPEPWAGPRPAHSFGPIAPQHRGLLDQLLGTGDQPTDEDCLTLNVWTPAQDGALRPVLVWLHGGAFVTGAGSSPWYDGAELARRGDVVVVTCNYRLGALGFTALPGREATGNLGLLDQLAVLAWVRRHIRELGGDPSNVTVFGESAGGASVVALLAAPASRGLLHRAVAQSPSLTQLRGRRRAEHAAEQLLAELGLGPGDTERLEYVPVDDVLAAQQRLVADPLAWFTAFSPVADGTVLPADVPGLLDAAARNPVPLLLGTTRDELRLFTAFDPAYGALDDHDLHDRAASVLGEGAPTALAAYRAARPGDTPGQVASALGTDHGFWIPMLRLAEARVAAGVPTWVYRFDWASPAFGGALGACHGIELPFVFANLHQPGVAVLTGHGPELAPLADTVQRAWVTFARDGRAGWAPYDVATRATMCFDRTARVVDDPDGDLRRLWGTR